MRKIFLIIIGFSTVLSANFTRDANGTVTDSRTNLQWQDNYNDNNNTIKNTTWESAINYCESLTLDGYSDWRLPNKNELLSIVDYNRDNPSINEAFVTYVNAYYWSSTTAHYSRNGAWTVNFSYGHMYNSAKNGNYYVRCVRAG